MPYAHRRRHIEMTPTLTPPGGIVKQGDVGSLGRVVLSMVPKAGH
jgi:hypothetical protein